MKQHKTKSNASWAGLSARQRQTLDGWLFDEHLGYEKTLERARNEMNFKGSMSSLRRYYQHTAQDRTMAGFTRAAALAEAVDGAAVSTQRLRDAGLKIAARVFLQMVNESPQLTKEWTPLAKLLVQAEENQIRRETMKAENELRCESLRFSRVRFQYNTVGAAMRLLPKLNELAEADREANLTVYERNKRLNDVRRGLFGDAIPELLPENEEEAAHPEIIERRYAEASERQDEEYAKERERIQRENAALERQYQEKLRAQAGAAAKEREEEDTSEADWEESERAGRDSAQPVAAVYDRRSANEERRGPACGTAATIRADAAREETEEERRQSEAHRKEYETYRKNMADPKLQAEFRAIREQDEREEEARAKQDAEEAVEEVYDRRNEDPPPLDSYGAASEAAQTVAAVYDRRNENEERRRSQTAATVREEAAKKEEQPEAPVILEEVQRKLTPEERAREIEELMYRARVQAEWESRRGR